MGLPRCEAASPLARHVHSVDMQTFRLGLALCGDRLATVADFATDFYCLELRMMAASGPLSVERWHLVASHPDHRARQSWPTTPQAVSSLLQAQSVSVLLCGYCSSALEEALQHLSDVYCYAPLCGPWGCVVGDFLQGSVYRHRQVVCHRHQRGRLGHHNRSCPRSAAVEGGLGSRAAVKEIDHAEW